MSDRAGHIRSIAGALILTLVVACAGPSQPTVTPSLPPESGTPSQSVAPETDGATATPTADGSPTSTAEASHSPTASPTVATPHAGPSYENPVFPADFPDPHVILVDETYYAYSTNSSGKNVPSISSSDLATWSPERDVMPGLPSWTGLNFGTRWAPGVMEIDGTFVLYFVACDANYSPPAYEGQVCVLPVDPVDRQCIGRAVADNPLGPFVDDSDEPFVCQHDLGGSIDAYPFRDVDGQLYLYWKNDGNCCGLPVGLWVQPLSEDGLELTGEPIELIQRDQQWESPLIENPAMVEHDGSYYLFYSGNWWESHLYAVGYAVCETPLGPCQKPLDEPIFEFTQEVFGPGGQSFFEDQGGNLLMAYHAWTAPTVGYPQGQRSLRIDPASFVDGMPTITGPTVGPQPLPR